MPYSDAISLIAHRTLEVAKMLADVERSELPDDTAKSVRGLAYVALFGMYEKVVAMCVFRAIQLCNSHEISAMQLTPSAMAFVLRPSVDSLRAVSADKLWSKSIELVSLSRSPAHMPLQSVFPADGSFMKPSQLKLIWEIFQLPGSPWPSTPHIGRIIEIVEARNHIAHGTESASERGGRVTNREMLQRTSDTESLCIHIASSFAQGATELDDFTV